MGLVSLEGRVKDRNIDGVLATDEQLVRVMLVHNKNGPIMLSNIKLMHTLSLIPSIFSVPLKVVARFQLKRKTNYDQFGLPKIHLLRCGVDTDILRLQFSRVNNESRETFTHPVSH